MKIRMPILFILFLSGGSFISGQDILEKLEEVATIDHKLMMPMRDGRQVVYRHLPAKDQ